jgi:hypothetical protein
MENSFEAEHLTLFLLKEEEPGVTAYLNAWPNTTKSGDRARQNGAGVAKWESPDRRTNGR